MQCKENRLPETVYWQVFVYIGHATRRTGTSEAIDSILSDKLLTPNITQHPLSTTPSMSLLNHASCVHQLCDKWVSNRYFIIYGCANDRFGGCGSVLGVNRELVLLWFRSRQVMRQKCDWSFLTVGSNTYPRTLWSSWWILPRRSYNDFAPLLYHWKYQWCCQFPILVVPFAHKPDQAPIPRSKVNRVLKTHIHPKPWVFCRSATSTNRFWGVNLLFGSYLHLWLSTVIWGQNPLIHGALPPGTYERDALKYTARQRSGFMKYTFINQRVM